MMNKERIQSEAARLQLTRKEVKALYREVPQFKRPAPLAPRSFVHNGSKSASVTGKDRHKYFDLPRVGQRGEVYVSPIVQFISPTDLHSGKAQQQPSLLKKKKRLRKIRKNESGGVSLNNNNNNEKSFFEERYVDEETGGVTIAIQTDYRDSEAQTLPYTNKNYVVPNGEKPEVLQLEHLTFSNGLNPINKLTLKEIDRIRRRREVEANLPLERDKKSFEKRCKMLKELEMAEWSEKEEKVKNEQSRKFHRLEKQIRRGMIEIEERNQLRIDEMNKQIMEEMEKELGKIEKKRGKALDSVIRKHANPENKKIERDIIKESLMKEYDGANILGDTGRLSTGGRRRRSLLNSIRRGGTDLNRGRRITVDIRPELMNDPDTLDRIERKHVGKINVRKKLEKTLSKKNEKKLKTTLRKEKNIQNDIEFARNIKDLRKNQKKKSKNFLDLYRKTPRIYRPPTPKVEFDDGDDELEIAVTLLQKLLRGRSTQNKYSFAKEKALELIKELQMVEQVIEKEREEKEKDSHKRVEEEKKMKKEKEYQIDDYQGEVVARSLDYLAKELVRQKELEKIMLLKARAEVEREKREKKEKEKREQEVIEMRKHQEEYNGVIPAINDTIDTYLTDVFKKAIKEHSYKCALKKVQGILLEKKNKYNKMREQEKTETGLGMTPNTDELEIKDLVSSFLIPQVKRNILKKKIINEQKKYVKAVNEGIEDLFDNIKKKLNEKKDEEEEDGEKE